LWDARTLKPGWTTPGSGGVVVFSADGKYVAVLGNYWKIRLLDAATDAQSIGTRTKPTSAISAITPDGQAILASPTKEASFTAKLCPTGRNSSSTY